MRSLTLLPLAFASLLAIAGCSNTADPGATAGVPTASEPDMADGSELPPPPPMAQPDASVVGAP